MLTIGEKVFVYWNLHKQLFSVKSVKTGRVVAHVDNLYLRDATFKVSEAGRQRVLREKRKNVHAGVQGYVTNEPPSFYDGVAKYNPYKGPHFTDSMQEFALKTAQKVHMFKSPYYDAPAVYYQGGEKNE